MFDLIWGFVGGSIFWIFVYIVYDPIDGFFSYESSPDESLEDDNEDEEDDDEPERKYKFTHCIIEECGDDFYIFIPALPHVVNDVEVVEAGENYIQYINVDKRGYIALYAIPYVDLDVEISKRIKMLEDYNITLCS